MSRRFIDRLTWVQLVTHDNYFTPSETESKYSLLHCSSLTMVTWSTRAFFPPSLWSSLFVAASNSAMTYEFHKDANSHSSAWITNSSFLNLKRTVKPSRRNQRAMKICCIASHVILSPPSLFNDNHKFKLDISLPKLTHKTKTSTLNTAHLSAYNIKKRLFPSQILTCRSVSSGVRFSTRVIVICTEHGVRTSVPPLWRGSPAASAAKVPSWSPCPNLRLYFPSAALFERFSQCQGAQY